jgi:hypothetical protein
MTVQQRIPLKAVPSQTLTTRLGDQDVRIDLRQASTGLYASVYLASVPVVQGRLCRNLVKLVRGGMVGDLYFYDTQRLADPDYAGLADRFRLYWS